MFYEGQYFYCKYKPVWVEIVYVGHASVEFVEHHVPTGRVYKNGWSVMTLPIPFYDKYVEVSSEAEARIESFKVFCDDNLRDFEKQLDYVLEPMIAINVKPSDIKSLQRFVKYKLGD